MPPRQRREPSGLFALFQPSQIQQFKEAFQLVDHDKDGWITEADLVQTFSSLGMSPSKPTLDRLLGQSTVNFTMFLTMMSQRLCEFDPESDLNDAFECFDDADSGLVKADEMRRWLADVGDRMEPHEIDTFLGGSFTDRHGNFNYREWIKVLRVNDDDDDQERSS